MSRQNCFVSIDTLRSNIIIENDISLYVNVYIYIYVTVDVNVTQNNTVE